MQHMIERNNMDWLKLLQEIFTVCIIPLLGILTKYLVSWIEAQKQKLVQEQDNELTQTYIKLLADTIETCVIATNQTYVNSLKEKNVFTPEAQKEAFRRTQEAVLQILSEDAQKYLSQIYGDLNIYIIKQIEKQVNTNKKENSVG